MNVEYVVYEKYNLTTSEWKVNHWRGWYVVSGTWSIHILGWCHINFI